MATVNDVYLDCAAVLLEPNGLITGVYTEEQFLLDFREVLWDFLQRAGLVKALLNQVVTSGTATVTVPDYAMNVEQALFSGRFLHYATALEMDNLIPKWRSESGTPKRWHDDRLPVKTIGLQPTPSASGDYVTFSAPMYGMISSTSLPVTLDLAYSASLRGTMAGFSGAPFVETIVPLYGTVGAMVPSAGNVTLLAPIKPIRRDYLLTDAIEVLPDSFLPYLKYGVLAYVFGRDGETRDKLREQYCQARFSEGTNIAQAISLEALEMEEVA